MKIQLYKIILKCFSKWLCQLTLPPTMYTRMHDLHFLIYAIVRLFNLCKLNRGNWNIIVVFLKLHFIDQSITVVPVFPPLLPLYSAPHPWPQATPTPLFVSTGHAGKSFGYSISYAVRYLLMGIL